MQHLLRRRGECLFSPALLLWVSPVPQSQPRAAGVEKAGMWFASVLVASLTPGEGAPRAACSGVSCWLIGSSLCTVCL